VKFDPVILGMTKGDVAVVVSDCVEAHLHCECVDRTDLRAWADHLGDEVAAMLEHPGDPDGTYDAWAAKIHGR